MNRGEREVVAEKVSSTVRVLELLGLNYEVGPPKNRRKAGNKSPRVVTVLLPNGKSIRVYNGTRGHTWANHNDGKPVVSVKSGARTARKLRTRSAACAVTGRRAAAELRR